MLAMQYFWSKIILFPMYSNTWCEWPKRGLLWTRKRSKKTSSSREGFSFVEKKKWKTLNAFFLECQASDQIRFLDWALLDITDVVVFVVAVSSSWYYDKGFTAMHWRIFPKVAVEVSNFPTLVALLNTRGERKPAAKHRVRWSKNPSFFGYKSMKISYNILVRSENNWLTIFKKYFVVL